MTTNKDDIDKMNEYVMAAFQPEEKLKELREFLKRIFLNVENDVYTDPAERYHMQKCLALLGMYLQFILGTVHDLYLQEKEAGLIDDDR